MLPFRQAIRLPIYLYGRIKFNCLGGKVNIKAPVQKGMIKIGYRWIDLWPTSFLPTQLNISGSLIFNGSCIISGGVALIIQSKTATCEIGNCCVIGGGSTIKSLDTLQIGDYTRITGNCIVMNSNMHYVKNIESGLIQKTWGPIKIGKRCWINQGTTITKGCVLPDYSITARSSFLNKDYSKYGTNLFLTGSPAKVKNSSVQRIYSLIKEQELSDYFKTHPNEEVFNDGVGLACEDENEKVF
jgi:acetyltransferase-like isoleucine patch superfamily enzyme